MDDILSLTRHAFLTGRAYYSRHARDEMLSEEFGRITDAEVEAAMKTAELLQAYPEDRPYPSVLILDFTEQGRPLHIVCAHAPETDTAVVITVYEPDPTLWRNFRSRTEQ